MNLTIPASLDDLNLDPFEVRLFLRLTRRNLINATPESLPNMARACRIGERKAQQALKTLLDLNMIRAICPVRIHHGLSRQSRNRLADANPRGSRSTCTPAAGADLDQDLDVEVQLKYNSGLEELNGIAFNLPSTV